MPCDKIPRMRCVAKIVPGIGAKEVPQRAILLTAARDFSRKPNNFPVSRNAERQQQGSWSANTSVVSSGNRLPNETSQQYCPWDDSTNRASENSISNYRRDNNNNDVGHHRDSSKRNHDSESFDHRNSDVGDPSQQHDDFVPIPIDDPQEQNEYVVKMSEFLISLINT